MTPTPEVCAWLGALIDGEGSIMLNRRMSKRESGLTYDHYRAVVSIYNTDQRLFDALAHFTGISRIYTHTRQPRENHKKTSYSWRMVATEIREWLPCFLPWLFCKREQAILLLEALDLAEESSPVAGQPRIPAERIVQIRDRRREIYEEIRALNTKGRETKDKSE